MSKFTDTLQSMLPKKFRKADLEKKKNKNPDANGEDEDEEEDDDPSVGGVSVNEGTHEKVFGVRKEVIKGVGAFFAVVLFAALFLAPGDDKKQEVRSDGFKQGTEEDINKGAKAKAKNKGPENNNYASLIEANKKEQEAALAQARAEGNLPPDGNGASDPNNSSSPSASQRNTVQPVTIAEPLPAIPRATSTPTVVPAINQPIAQSQPSPNQVAGAREQQSKPQKDSRYSSAISFSVGGASTSQNAETGTQSANPNGTMGGNQTGTNNIGYFPVSATSGQIAPRSIAIGTIIPVRLMTGINSDSPGHVMAMVTANVMDSLTGKIVLIPAGSRLFGSIGNGVASKGRINLVFSTILTPDNKSYSIGTAFEAMDGLGYSGIKGKVDKHTETRIGGGMLAAGIAALGSIAAGNTNGNSQTYSAGQLASQGALASLINQATSMIQSGSNIGPTVTVKPGYDFSVYVNQTVQF